MQNYAKNAQVWESVPKLMKVCQKNDKILESISKLRKFKKLRQVNENVCQNLRKYEKMDQNMRKNSKSWESIIYSNTTCESMPKVKKLPKCGKSWERMPNASASCHFFAQSTKADWIFGGGCKSLT